MYEYLHMVYHVLKHGEWVTTRNSRCKSVFAYHYTVDLSKGFPLLTTKQMYFDSIVHELLWYLSGEHHISSLRKYTKIWDSWADKEGNLESAYPRFWRNFPLMTNCVRGEVYNELEADNVVWSDENLGYGIDQIQYIINCLQKIKETGVNNRRMVLTAWHPDNATVSKLPPCHILAVFNVQSNKLNCHLTQRSGDVGLGIPFNLACYSMLTQILAQYTGFEVGMFSHTIVDLHIYENHVKALEKQLQREPYALPTLTIANKHPNDLKFEDFTLTNYTCHPKLYMRVVA